MGSDTSVGISRVDQVCVSKSFCYGRDIVREITFLLILSLLCLAPAIAQSPNATINGIVLDPSGAVIAGAEVVVVNDATGVQYTTKTNGEGIYVVPNLPPGPYRIQVSNRGFKTIIKPDITLNIQDALAINFTLPIGAVSEIVTVSGGAPSINTESGSVSTVIDRNFVESLPLNGRSFSTLLQLTPGVVIAPTSVASPGQYSIAGQRTDANNFEVDGVSGNFGVTVGLAGIGSSGLGQAQAFSGLGGTNSLVSVEALQEFRIETSSFAPEFGRAPGGQVQLATRPGTNEFHGGVFDYFRNTALDANDWFNNAATPQLPRAPEHLNDFGGYLGGPIIKSRSFFFLSYEGQRLLQPQTFVSLVPSLSARDSAPSQLGPFLNAYPLPNGPVTPDGTMAQFTGDFSNRDSLNAGSLRIDHTFNDRLTIFGRVHIAPSSALSQIFGPSTLESTEIDTDTFTLGANMTLSSRFFDALRGNYSTQKSATSFRLDSLGGAVPVDSALLLGGLSTNTSFGEMTVSGLGSLLAGRAAGARTQQWNFTNDASLLMGAHQLKFGADYRAIFLKSSPPTNEVVQVGGSLSILLSTGSVILEVVGFRTTDLLAQTFSLYGQDTWKVNSRLTLTYGLRWELAPAPEARGNTALAAWQNVNDPPAITLAPTGTPLWATQFGNFAPRVGLAYRLASRGDLVLRVGSGIFYDLGLGQAAGLANNFPNTALGIFPGVAVPVNDITPFLPSFSLAAPYQSYQVLAFTPGLRLPRSYQWNVALEKTLGDRTALSATYVGQAGRDLLRKEALLQPNPNFLPGSLFSLTANRATSDYEALQLQFRRPLGRGLQAIANYTWSHSLDNASDDTVGLVSSTVIPAQNDRASSDFDVRQSFSGAVTYELPGISDKDPFHVLTNGWSLEMLVIARTGLPFNAYVLTQTLQGASPRPDLVPGQPLWLENPQAPGGKSLNPAAFAIQTTARQGTEGRNDIPGFGLTQVDLSLGRKFSIHEGLNLQLRADAFNLLNHPNFVNPQGIVGFGPTFLQSQGMLDSAVGGAGVSSPLFQEGGPRSLQLSLKLLF